MPLGAPNSEKWYEDDIAGSRRAPGRKAVAGRPGSWRNYDWWMVGSAYSGLWLLESWTSGGFSSGGIDLFHMAYGLTTLLLALASCSVLYRMLKPRSERLAAMIVAAGGLAMLLAHGL